MCKNHFQTNIIEQLNRLQQDDVLETTYIDEFKNLKNVKMKIIMSCLMDVVFIDFGWFESICKPNSIDEVMGYASIMNALVLNIFVD